MAAIISTEENTEHLPNQNYHLKIVCVHMLDSVPKHIYFFGICLLVIVVIFFNIIIIGVCLKYLYLVPVKNHPRSNDAMFLGSEDQ